MNRVNSVHFFRLIFDDTWRSVASIDVPGLGEVKIEDCLSQKTIDTVCEEVLFALSQKMGMKAEQLQAAPVSCTEAQAGGGQNAE